MYNTGSPLHRTDQFWDFCSHRLASEGQNKGQKHKSATAKKPACRLTYLKSIICYSNFIGIRFKPRKCPLTWPSEGKSAHRQYMTRSGKIRIVYHHENWNDCSHICSEGVHHMPSHQYETRLGCLGWACVSFGEESAGAPHVAFEGHTLELHNFNAKRTSLHPVSYVPNDRPKRE